jgi:hypothetical protein
MAKKVKRSHAPKDTHPSGHFQLTKGDRAIGEERSSPEYDMGKPPAGSNVNTSMKANKQRRVDLVNRAHAHTQVSPGPTDGVVRPVQGSGDFSGKALAARIRKAKVRTGIMPRGSNLIESEPYSGEVGPGQ